MHALVSCDQLNESLCLIDRKCLRIDSLRLKGFAEQKLVLYRDKVKWYIFRGSNSNFHFCLLFQWGSTLKGKNLLLEEQILSFKSRPHFGGATLSGT